MLAATSLVTLHAAERELTITYCCQLGVSVVDYRVLTLRQPERLSYISYSAACGSPRDIVDVSAEVRARG